MEIQIGSKGRITLPYKIRMQLGIKEGDHLTLEVTSKGIILKPKGPRARARCKRDIGNSKNRKSQN